MARGDVELNAVGYRLKPFEDGTLVRRYTLEPFAEARREQGLQRQEDITPYSSRIFSSMTGGFGRNRIPADKAQDPASYRKFWNSTLETRWPGDVRLPGRAVKYTDPTNVEVVRAGVEYKGDLWLSLIHI